jgi:DNA-directed RNA polymerase specialized sigma24 family protein
MLSGGTWCRFRTTRWSLVGRVRSQHQADEAMETLSLIYRPAVFAYLRRTGMKAEAADELTQGFFADIVLGKRLFGRLNAERGRARDYLLRALKNYQCDTHRREVVRGKGHALAGDALKREEAFVSAQSSSDPAAAFDKRAATATLEEALKRCESHCTERGLTRNWTAFEARVSLPALHGVEPLPLAQLAEELGFRTAADVSSAVQGVERRAHLLVRQVLAETSPDASIDDEYKEFIAALTSGA